MRKILLLFLILFLFTSCEKPLAPTESPMDLMAKIVSHFPDIPVARGVYFESAEMLDAGYFDPEYACYIYTGQFIADFNMLDKLEAYAVRIPDGKSAFEIHIFKVRDISDIESVEDMCRSRLNILKSGNIAGYDPELFYTIIEKAEVYTVDNYVFLLCTTDNDVVKEIIRGN